MRTRKHAKHSRLKEQIVQDLRINYRLYFLLLSLLIISAAAGGFSAKSLPEEAKQNFANYLRGAIVALNDKPQVGDIILGFLPSILIFFCMAASAVHLALMPVSFVALAAAGWTWGLTSGVISSSYGFKGVVLSVVCIFMAQVIPTLCYFKVFCNGVRRSAKSKPKAPLKTLLGAASAWGLLLLLSLLLNQMLLPSLARLLIGGSLE